MEHYGRSDAEVASLQNYYQRVGLLFLVLTMGFAIWGLYLFGKSDLPFIFEFAFSVFPLLIVGPLALKNLFWASQLKHRRLFTISYYIKNLRALHRSQGVLAVLILSLAFAVASPLTTHAQEAGNQNVLASQQEEIKKSLSGTTEFDEDDLFGKLLGIVIGGVGPVQSPPKDMDITWVEPVQNAFKVFNITLLAVASMMLSWYTVNTVVNSAYEGQSLGKKVHNIWAPIRITAGLGFGTCCGGLLCSSNISFTTYSMGWRHCQSSLVCT